MKGAIYMLMMNHANLAFCMDSVERMPAWIRDEKYYNCDNFFDMIALQRKTKKNKKQNKS